LIHDLPPEQSLIDWTPSTSLGVFAGEGFVVFGRFSLAGQLGWPREGKFDLASCRQLGKRFLGGDGLLPFQIRQIATPRLHNLQRY